MALAVLVLGAVARRSRPRPLMAVAPAILWTSRCAQAQRPRSGAPRRVAIPINGHKADGPCPQSHEGGFANLNPTLFEAVKKKVSSRTRRRILHRRLAARQSLPAERALPDFLIIGGQRCGTSSLYKYLGAHPQMVPSLRKETRYFSVEYERGIGWYRAHFPTAAAMHGLQWLRGSSRTFEATPDYLFDPRTPSRVAATLPHARFVVLLRDPVARAYSHWRHIRQLGFEALSFTDAVKLESERIGDGLERLHRGEVGSFKDAFRFSYITRGHYAEQLERWLQVFPADHFLILGAEDFYSHPEQVLAQVCRFVGVDEWMPTEFRNYSRSATSSYSGQDDVTEALQEDLRKHFAAENEGLPRIAGRRFPWT